MIQIIPKERTLRKLRNIFRRFFENQPNEICCHLSKKASKGGFLGPDKLQNHTYERKGKQKKKKSEKKERRRREKSSGCFFSFFYNSYFRDSFWLKKNLLDVKGPFGGNVVKNPAETHKSK